MRIAALLVAVLILSPTARGADPAPRHGIQPDLKRYPQATPKEALASVIKAVEDRRIDYLLAHLADPDWVEKRVKDLHGGKFEELVKETTPRMDALTLKQFQRFAKDGEWEVSDTAAAVRLKDVTDRVIHLRKVEGRWFLENRNRPPAE
jgi:hypothetical protein